MTARTDAHAPATADTEDDAAFWARAARYGFVRPERIDPDQAWFWTRDWIAGEIEVEIALAEGPGTIYYSTEEFIEALERRAKQNADLPRG